TTVLSMPPLKATATPGKGRSTSSRRSRFASNSELGGLAITLVLYPVARRNATGKRQGESIKPLHAVLVCRAAGPLRSDGQLPRAGFGPGAELLRPLDAQPL